MVRLSFGRGDFKEPGYLHRNLMAQLDAVERETGAASGGVGNFVWLHARAQYAAPPKQPSRPLPLFRRHGGRRAAEYGPAYPPRTGSVTLREPCSVQTTTPCRRPLPSTAPSPPRLSSLRRSITTRCPSSAPHRSM